MFDEFILASGSPRRMELLKPYFQNLQVFKPHGELSAGPGDDPRFFVSQNADLKAQNVLENLESSWEKRSYLLLAADTVVVLDQEIIEKPRDKADAKKMLVKLSGKRHQVITALSLSQVNNGKIHSVAGMQTTYVWFRDLEPKEIQSYISTQEPYDKAGGYAIQGWAAHSIPKIQGCYYNIMGLPLFCLDSLLRKHFHISMTR